MNRLLSRTVLAASLCCLPAQAFSGQAQVTEDQRQEFTSATETYAECSGVWSAAAILTAQKGNVQTATQLNNFANGAEKAHWALLNVLGTKRAEAKKLAKSSRGKATNKAFAEVSKKDSDYFTRTAKDCINQHLAPMLIVMDEARKLEEDGVEEQALWDERIADAFERGKQMPSRKDVQ